MLLLASACMILCSCKIMEKKKLSFVSCFDLLECRFCCLINNKRKSLTCVAESRHMPRTVSCPKRTTVVFTEYLER